MDHGQASQSVFDVNLKGIWQLSGPDTSQDAAYCANQVRLGDKDRYLSALYVPNDKRRHVMALYALYNEITKIPELVSETSLGEIRLMWWHDAVADLYQGKTADQPLLRELSAAIEQGNLEKSVVLNVINASGANLYPVPFASKQDLENHSGETEAALIYLTSHILLPLHAAAVSKVAREAGLANALTTYLSTMVTHASYGVVQIPEEILSAHNIKPEDFFQGTLTETKRIIFSEMLDWARASLERARDHIEQIPLAAMPAFLPVCVADLYLKAMTAYGYNPMRQTPRVSPLRRQWRIMRSAQKAKF